MSAGILVTYWLRLPVLSHAVTLGKPLGARGLEWLKIHLINLTGLKKRESNAVRLAYADEVLPLALQSASSPFKVSIQCRCIATQDVRSCGR